MSDPFHLHRGRWHSPQPTALAIGNFDGVHRGHQQLLQQLQAEEALPVLLSFAPHPKTYLLKQSQPLLTPWRDRAHWLLHYGLRHWWLLGFNAALRQLSPVDFVEKILLPARPRLLVVGEDFRFGHRAAGDVELLQRLGRRHGFRLAALPIVQAGDERISSTRVRQALAAQDWATVEALLGHPLTLSGRVQHGAKRGRELRAPTANIAAGEDFAAPNGVYVVRWRDLWGVANLGHAPTFAGQRRKLEVHFFAENLDLYGQCLTVALKYFIRPERTFATVEALQMQIQKDIETARAYIQKNH